MSENGLCGVIGIAEDSNSADSGGIRRYSMTISGLTLYYNLYYTLEMLPINLYILCSV